MNSKIRYALLIIMIYEYIFYYSYAYFGSLPDEDWYIQSKFCLLYLTQLDSCLAQNMTLNTDTDYSAVDASFKYIKHAFVPSHFQKHA